MSFVRTARFAALAIAMGMLVGSTSFAQDEKETGPNGFPRLISIPAGNVVLYLGTGLRSSALVDASIAVHCTSFVPDAIPSPYPFDIAIEFYDFGGFFKAQANLTMTAQNQTKNAVTKDTLVYDENVDLDITLDPGSVRIYGPKSVASGVLCSADMTSRANPPEYQREVPLVRVTKFKAPKPTF